LPHFKSERKNKKMFHFTTHTKDQQNMKTPLITIIPNQDNFDLFYKGILIGNYSSAVDAMLFWIEYTELTETQATKGGLKTA